MTAKKIFIIAVILLVLIGGTLIIYNLFSQKAASPSATEQAGVLPSTAPGTRGGETTTGGTDQTSQTSEGAAAIAAAKILPISQEKVLAPTIGSDGKSVKYFSRTDGKLYESDFNGSSKKTLSSVTLKNLVKAVWSPDKEKIVSIFSDNNATKKYFYSYSNNQTSLLGERLGYIAWSPDSKKIAYHYIDPTTGQNNISVANPDGSGWKNIFKTRLDNVVVEWPIKEKISLRLPPSGLAQGLLYAISSATGDFTKILSDIFGLNTKWSPKADKILYSFTDNEGKSPGLALSDEQGAKTKDLKLAGIVDKCVWSKDDRTIFCALPQEISSNATWPDDYYKGLVILSDDFYKIDLENDAKTKIAGSTDAVGYDTQDLFLSPKEDYLFFVNKRNGLLYRIKL